LIETIILLINKQAKDITTRKESILIEELFRPNIVITRADVRSQDPGKKNNQLEIIKPLELYFVEVGQRPRFWQTNHARVIERSISKARIGEKIPGGKFSYKKDCQNCRQENSTGFEYLPQSSAPI
tara:strand:- start:396 stop:773 length:378 start_codon:yes stop_codon:yes gene_type:complete